METIYVWKYNGDATLPTATIYQYVYFIPVKDIVGDHVLVGQSDVDPRNYRDTTFNKVSCPMPAARKIWKELQQEGKYSLLQRDGQ